MSFQSCGGEGAEDVAQDSSLSRNSTSISNAYTPVHTQYREYRERRDSWAIFSVSLKMSARTFSTFYLFRNLYLLPLLSSFILIPVFGNFDFNLFNFCYICDRTIKNKA